jgi:hypothetical protein
MKAIDPTEETRRALVTHINAQAAERADLEIQYGQVWNAAEFAADFEVLEFLAPFAVVKRKSDQQLGSVLFQHWPRYYFAFHQDPEDHGNIMTFDIHGTAHCLWNEAVPLQELGRLEMKRAATIEFNSTTQVWEVRLASAPEAVAFAHPSRETCLHWERNHALLQM